MISLSGDLYLWIKTLHIISVIAWLAGLLYLPRLFVYHCEAKKGSEFSDKLKVMERRLMKTIMRPARIASVLFGLLLLMNLDKQNWFEVWLILKLVCVLFLIAIHDLFEYWRRCFEIDSNTHSQKFFRAVNEIPTVLFVLAVVFVVIKPF